MIIDQNFKAVYKNAYFENILETKEKKEIPFWFQDI